MVLPPAGAWHGELQKERALDGALKKDRRGEGQKRGRERGRGWGRGKRRGRRAGKKGFARISESPGMSSPGPERRIQHCH